MIISKWLLLLLCMCFLPGVNATCSIRPSSVFYVNGIGDSQPEADIARQKLDLELRQSLGISISDECLYTATAYNRSVALVVDFVQAAYQKAREIGISAIEFWPAILRLTAPPWLDDIIDQVYPRNGDSALYVVGAQLDQHINDYYSPALANNRHLVIVGHSQGNFYANDAWKKFDREQRNQVNLVAVSTPATKVEDGGPHTKLWNDTLAAFMFPLSLPWNVINVEPCDKDLSHPFSWLCHDMVGSYLHGTNSKRKIVIDIIAALPSVPTAACGTAAGVPASLPPVTSDRCAGNATWSIVTVHPTTFDWTCTKGTNTVSCSAPRVGGPIFGED